MRHVEVCARISAMQPVTVFDTLADFERYAELVAVVRSVTVDHHAGGIASSSWEVEFRGGLLRWVEENTFDRDRLRLDFRQTEGDFADFYGSWVIEPDGEDVNVTLMIDFDFGIPSLARIVEPVAERVLNDVTRDILLGLFGERVRLPQPAAVPDRPKRNELAQEAERLCTATPDISI